MKTFLTALGDLIVVLAIMAGLALFAIGVHQFNMNAGQSAIQIFGGLIIIFGAWFFQRRYIHPAEKNTDDNDGK